MAPYYMLVSMSHIEDINEKLVATTSTLQKDWKRESDTVNANCLDIRSGFDRIADSVLNLGSTAVQILNEVYAGNMIMHNNMASAALANGRHNLSELLAGTENPHAIAALDELQQAHDASKEITGSMQLTHAEAVAEIKEKAEALVLALRVVGQRRLLIPFLSVEDLMKVSDAVAADTSAPVDLHGGVREHISNSMNEIIAYQQNI